MAVSRKVLPEILDTASNLTELNEIIADGVVCKEAKSTRFKVGDGVRKYAALPYVDQSTKTLAQITNNSDLTTKEYVDTYVNANAVRAYKTTNATIGTLQLNSKIIIANDEANAKTISLANPTSLVLFPEA